MEDKKIFDTRIEADDWRSSAAILGLIRYFDEFNIPYNRKEIFSEDNSQKEWDGIEFNRSEIKENLYFKYVERRFANELHHVKVEKILQSDEYSDEMIDLVNNKLKANAIMDNVFSKIKFDGTNADIILKLISDNRQTLITETYREKMTLYRNFCNPKKLFSDENKVCRLNGYYVDMAKKGKSISYKFDMTTFAYIDRWYYDFIPFAFTNASEAVFINDNSSIADLYNTNESLLNSVKRISSLEENKFVSSRKILFENIISSSKFLEHDTEIIIKRSKCEFFETMYLRKESIKIIKSIKNHEILCISPYISNDYVNIQKQVTDAIINQKLLDELIEILLKEDYREKGNYYFINLELIIINRKIRRLINDESGGDDMDQKMKRILGVASEVLKSIPENKVKSYRSKLISSLVFKDYNRYCEILLNLADYSGVNMYFAYDLFEDFEKNKDLAFAFANALTQNKSRNNNE